MIDSYNFNNITGYNSAATPPLDFIARFWHESEKGDEINISAMRTKVFTENLSSVFAENSLLKKIVKNLWNTTKYNNEYIAYLLGQYDDKEFSYIAKKFAISPSKKIPRRELINNINTLFSVVEDESLTPSEISIMLNADCSLIESTMSIICKDNDDE